ncbi:MAG TPA: hypothetical protein VED59_07940 [Acidimicrobiales bacterium]|nr:hypothetical protein [Acidimicrobiales bacterium]
MAHPRLLGLLTRIGHETREWLASRGAIGGYQPPVRAHMTGLVKGLVVLKADNELRPMVGDEAVMAKSVEQETLERAPPEAMDLWVK